MKAVQDALTATAWCGSVLIATAMVRHWWVTARHLTLFQVVEQMAAAIEHHTRGQPTAPGTGIGCWASASVVMFMRTLLIHGARSVGGCCKTQRNRPAQSLGH